ncbi:glycosyltransferase [Algoriphagus sp. AGSA1]|uniref:glycosyltransferase family 2 protein n=1 Tax=Algoriphagus sp. AGSA1 TaxID=2907213 RepID=UPI001F2B1072|nr:glycosyltransferase family 2 protein [Algoriphagus sp. AGSA1]MCE7055268.1 glycosyltransferase [Algoriphagus sp. AGSA1]
MSYKVTIIISVYNTESFIERCLNSALNQTFESIEYLLIDDVSTDNTIAKIKGVVEKSPRRKDVKLIQNKVNKGIGAVRDLAFRIFEGEYLFFLDGDDELFVDSIEKLYNRALHYDSDIVIGSIEFVDTLNEGKDGDWFMRDLISDKPADLFFMGRFYPMTWNKLYRRELIVSNDIRCIPTNQEDEIISLQMFIHAKKVVSIADITYKYFYRTDSLSNKMVLKNFISYSISIQYLRDLRVKLLGHPYYLSYLQYVYNLNYSLIWRLKNSTLVSEYEKTKLTGEFSKPFLTIKEIVSLDSPLSLKMKFSFLFLPDSLLFYFLNNFSPFFRKLKKKYNRKAF